MGPQDQRPVQSRNDVLVYTSAPLAAPLEVIGRARLHLFAATSARDTDFTATLCDLFPDGRAINLCEGIVRGRYRASLETSALLEPDRVYEFTIDLGVLCNLFLPGHRLRLHVSSSNYPAFDRNPNTGGPFAQEGPFDPLPASQMVLHSARDPSRVVLPVTQG